MLRQSCRCGRYRIQHPRPSTSERESIMPNILWIWGVSELMGAKLIILRSYLKVVVPNKEEHDRAWLPPKWKKHPNAESAGGDWSHPRSPIRGIFGPACEAWSCPTRQTLVILHIPVLPWPKIRKTRASGPCHISRRWFSTYVDFKKRAKWNQQKFLSDIVHLIYRW